MVDKESDNTTTKDNDNNVPEPFQVNDRILCFHGPLLYEAKVLKAETRDGIDPDIPEPGQYYFVHYKGWKQTWDEWVDESRTLEFSDDNLAKQRNLKKAILQDSKGRTVVVASKHAPSATAAAMASQNIDTDGDHVHRGSGGTRKRLRESMAEKSKVSTSSDRDDRLAPAAANGPSSSAHTAHIASNMTAAMAAASTGKGAEIKMPIPNALKAQLVDDWERITKDKLLVPLPRTPTVTDMLEQYREHRHTAKERRKPMSRRDDDIVDEIIDGLKVYFDRALGNVLLYRFERYQYQQILEKYPKKTPSETYGPEHLLRLFVQMPGLIAHTNMDEDAIQLLKEHLGDMLKYMNRSIKTLFVDQYENASPSYVAISKDGN